VATLGVAIGGPYALLPELARQVQARGFDAVWVSETNQESLVQSALVAHVTDGLAVGTNITLAFPRSPTVTAMAAWDLNVLTGGRFRIGLGSQVRRIIVDRFSADFDRPARRMAEYVQAMRTVWAMNRGEDARFEGEIYRVVHAGLGRPFEGTDLDDPAVYVAAVGPLMTKAAATRADGMLGHPFTSLPYLEDDVVARVEAALDEAGRAREEFTLAQGVILCIAEDRAVAVREAKQQIGFYGTTPNYKPVFASYGDEGLLSDLRVAWKKRDLDALVAAVPDEAVERYAVAGTPDEVRDRLGAYADRVDHLILGGAWYKVPPQRLAENFWAILETFGSPTD
jgi:probable F420-dependent oxidoreductase